MNKKTLRQLYIKEEAIIEEFPWLNDVPFDIRDEAMNDVLKALKATYAKKDVKHFEFKFRSKKDETQSITVLKKHWKHFKTKGNKYGCLFDNRVLRGHEPLPEKLEFDSRLIRTRLGHYYLCIPTNQEIQSDSQAPLETNHCTISLDPGVRTFMTGYDADGTLCEWGAGDMSRIYRLCHAHDKLQAKWSKPSVRHRQRYCMRVAARRIRLKIRNLVDEVHKRLSKWLCENFRCVVLPKFETSQMVQKRKRKLGSKTARAMMTWSHYRFRQRLLSKARAYPWCNVVVTSEEFTSKTCGQCGRLHSKLGNSKSFQCPSCGYIADRDVNGARNILLRHLTVNNKRIGEIDSRSVGATPLRRV